MPTQIKEVRPPHGLTRLMLRFPIWLFRMHLGWIVGERFLLLTHTGRSSGLLRQTILEVQQHETASDAYYVSFGWGDKADWLRNVEKTPEVMITVGRRHVHARAERLGSEEAERAILEYAKRNPLAIRVLPRLMGYRLDGSEEDFRALAHLGIVVAFRPSSAVSKKAALEQ
jgi:deazaflavin-dependent oxidoreductase (nitroreductase family)